MANRRLLLASSLIALWHSQFTIASRSLPFAPFLCFFLDCFGWPWFLCHTHSVLLPISVSPISVVVHGRYQSSLAIDRSHIPNSTLRADTVRYMVNDALAGLMSQKKSRRLSLESKLKVGPASVLLLPFWVVCLSL
jgi:hypothetical protein